MLVDADDDVEDRRILHRRGHDDALGAALQMALDRSRRHELAGAFEHDIDAKIAPWNIARSSLRREPQPPIIDRDRIVALMADRGAPATLHAVEFKQMGGRSGPALDLVEMHDVEPVAGTRIIALAVGCAERRPQRETPDAPHAVDADPHDPCSIR